MPTFRNLKDLERFANAQILQSISVNLALENLFAEAMYDVIWTNVYSVYEPIEYERREEDGGLLDERNMRFTEHIPISSKLISSLFENLAEGKDTMEGQYISEMIEKGIKEPYNNPDGIWAEPRPFTSDTTRYLNTAKNSELLQAFKAGLIRQGLKVR
ncbi:hypothetical protein ACIQ1D_19390 [Lysinibacillus xylanilyticus]|uniref:hypothetical protein n=1 Tax=Lysinibacillus xylanilyticus TaxID=582475 RepID=UPI0037F39BA9